MLWNKPIRKVSFFSVSFYYHYLLFLFKHFYERIRHLIWKPADLAPTIMDESERYVQKQTKLFLEKVSENQKDKEKGNQNIDPICYSLTEFQESILPENNTLEHEWKRRIMMEYTPRGNVIMYYDIFKHAFAYASDSYIPYSVLNVCAMKYVVMFRCMDFFVDSTILPEEILSPFSLLQNEVEIKKKEDADIKKKELGISFTGAPFAKLKNYSSQKEKESDSELKIKSKAGDMIKYSNNFRNLGKISNISFLLKPKKNHPITCNSIGNSNPLLSSFDYLSYKKSLLENK
jgi:hypothetical protein